MSKLVTIECPACGGEGEGTFAGETYLCGVCGGWAFIDVPENEVRSDHTVVDIEPERFWETVRIPSPKETS